jgi:hypothetical protein
MFMTVDYPLEAGLWHQELVVSARLSDQIAC